MSICRIFILNYYSTHYQYKCAIVMIWGYGILYLQFGATLHVNKDLIKNSVIFKIVKFPLSLPSYQWSVPQGAQSPQTLYYIILWLQYPCILQLALYIYIYIPPSPPPHSASYNITATTTCASRVSATVGHRKRPPVQVTVATTTCASRVSALVGHRKQANVSLPKGMPLN